MRTSSNLHLTHLYPFLTHAQTYRNRNRPVWFRHVFPPTRHAASIRQGITRYRQCKMICKLQKSMIIRLNQIGFLF